MLGIQQRNMTVVHPTHGQVKHRNRWLQRIIGGVTLIVGQWIAGRRSCVGRGAILAAFCCLARRRAFFFAGYLGSSRHQDGNEQHAVQPT